MSSDESDFFLEGAAEDSFSHDNSNEVGWEQSNPQGNGALYDVVATDRILNRKIQLADEKIDSLILQTERKLEQIRKDTDTQLGDLKKEVNDSKNRIVETLALFVALFTFLSLQVQIFKDEPDANRVLGLVLISGGLITFFVLILDLMIKSRDESKGLMLLRFWLLLGMSIALITCGVTFFKVH